MKNYCAMMIAAAVTVAAGAASAALPTVDSGLWQSGRLADSQYSFGAISKDDYHDLAGTCADWMQIAYSEGGSQPNLPQSFAARFQAWRTSPLASASDRFQSTFELLIPYAGDQIAADLQKQAMVFNSGLQSRGDSLLPVASFNLDFAGQVLISPQSPGLVGVARSLSLEPAKILPRQNGLLVYGRDLACDLIQARAAVKVLAQGETVVGEADVKALNESLKYLETAANYALKKKSSPIGRAAYLGMKISRELSRQPDEVVEQKIEAVLARFFDPTTLSVNSLWGQDAGTYYLYSRYRADYPVKITFQGSVDASQQLSGRYK
jgi:hypothetical protein